jgi:tight adherence protein C
MAAEGFPLPFGLEPIDVATLLAGMATMAVCVAIWGATTVRDPMRGRVKALQERRDELKAGMLAPARRAAAKQRDKVEVMRKVVTSLKLLQDDQAKKAQEKLMCAGWRSKDALVTFLFGKLIAPVVVFFVLMFLFLATDFLSHMPLMARMGIALGGVLLASVAPEIVVKNQTQKRISSLRKGLPDALDLLVICTEAGLTVDAAFSRVARELGHGYPELADELTLTSVELGFLQDRRVALENFAKRVPLSSIKSIVTTLIQTEKYGTPLAAALRVLSAEFRNERMMKAEEKAARLPAIMTVPLILFIMPTIFVVLLGPAACKISDEFINGM